MRLSVIIQRLVSKTNTPELRDAIVNHTADKLPNRCIIWTGSRTPGGPAVRRRRDANNLLYPFIEMVKPFGFMTLDRKREGVHRILHRLISGTTEEFTGRQTCNTPFCIHPLHWRFTTPTHIQPEAPAMPEQSDEWTFEEAREQVDAYIARNYPKPLNPEHDLLIDVPITLLQQVIDSEPYYSPWVFSQRDSNPGE